MNGLVVGIDNGVSGSLAYQLPGDPMVLTPTPTKTEQNFQKKKANVTRIDHAALGMILTSLSNRAIDLGIQLHVVLEKPFTNPGNFVATASSLRAHEATLVVLEQLGIGYQFLDAKEWQKKMLPAGLKGREEQKKASRDLGARQFPHLAASILKNKASDADAVWIAEYARLHL